MSVEETSMSSPRSSIQLVMNCLVHGDQSVSGGKAMSILQEFNFNSKQLLIMYQCGICMVPGGMF